MAGHSKFKNIMHRKGAQDKKRAKVFTKLIRELTVAAKSGLPDPEHNPRLRAAVVAARAANMPRDNVDRAIKKAAGGDDGVNYEEVRYEGYGTSGVAVIVEVLTDNRNRAASNIRAAFTKFGGNLGETNSVSFMFDHVGQIEYPLEKASEEEMLEASIEAGANDVVSSNGSHEIVCAIDELHAVRESLMARFEDPIAAKLIWKPKSLTPVDAGAAETLMKFIDTLEDNDDVQEVYANFDISDDIMEQLAQQ